MIQSREDYNFYLEADRIAFGFEKKKLMIGLEVWKFQLMLRKLEYYINCRNSKFWRPWTLLIRYRFHRLSTRIGFSIPPNVFGPGLSIPHIGTIVVNPWARVGENCRLHVCVTIGTEAGLGNQAPTIGNNVFIGPGAKIYGKIAIADDVAIGANSVVNKSFLKAGIGIAGVPAIKINEKGSLGIVTRATEILRQKKQ